jgi:hypothetical protein
MGQDPSWSRERQGLCGRYARLPTCGSCDFRESTLGERGRKADISSDIDHELLRDLSSADQIWIAWLGDSLAKIRINAEIGVAQDHTPPKIC